MIEDDSEKDRQKRLRAAQRVVIKVGTSIISRAEGGVCSERIEPLVRSISELKRAGRQVVLVSSGAVGLGAGQLGLHPSRLHDVVVRQACAAVGQSLLMHSYEQLFRVHDIRIAQVLLTEDDFVEWQRYTNLRRTMEKLLKLDVLPIVNENDTVSSAELEYASGQERAFGDNDRLAALVMSRLESDALVLLTNVDGLLRYHPRRTEHGVSDDERPELVSLVPDLTDEVRAWAAGPSAGGRGGMLTKLDAAQIAMQAGGVAVIANGMQPGVLEDIFAGKQVGTTFMSTSRMAGKRRWLAYVAGVRGRVIVNEGAREAIISGKASLLSSGVVRVEQQFDPQDVVSIADCEGREFARGIINCASAEAAALIQEVTAAPAGRQHSRVLVTRDNLVLSEQR
jgi:glutamate 5-kinase